MRGVLSAMCVVVVCLLMLPSQQVYAQPLRNLVRKAEDNRELIRVSNEDAQQARRDNIERIRNSGPSARCRPSANIEFFAIPSRQLLLVPAPAQPSFFEFRQSFSTHQIRMR